VSGVIAYWDHGVKSVPQMTGAAHLLDASDVRSICADLDIALPFGSVLDVGCGTGRVAQLCEEYEGVDIAPSAVEYCAERGLKASAIYGPADLRGQFDWVVCLSVFTHICEQERVAYLEAFAKLAPNVLVDIIPGDGGGNIALWSSNVETFEANLRGYSLLGTTERVSVNERPHRYYRLKRS